MIPTSRQYVLQCASILIAFGMSAACAIETQPRTGTVNSADGVPIVYEQLGLTRFSGQITVTLEGVNYGKEPTEIHAGVSAANGRTAANAASRRH
jgi:hypothetical protein